MACKADCPVTEMSWAAGMILGNTTRILFQVHFLFFEIHIKIAARKVSGVGWVGCRQSCGRVSVTLCVCVRPGSKWNWIQIAKRAESCVASSSSWETKCPAQGRRERAERGAATAAVSELPTVPNCGSGIGIWMQHTHTEKHSKCLSCNERAS